MADASVVRGEEKRGLEHPVMTIEPSELLERLSETLRHEVGPAVEEEYTRTQAFMASVILGKLAKQLAMAPAHGEAERADVHELHEGLAGLLARAPVDVAAAAPQAKEAGTVASLGPLIEAIYRSWVDEPEGQEALTLIRAALRRDIDRRMEIAR